MKALLLSFILFFSYNFSFAQDFVRAPYQNAGMSRPILADFNGDQKIDVFGINFFFNGRSEPALMIHAETDTIDYNKKDITLSFTPKGYPAATDIDGDGDIDILIAGGDTMKLYLLENDGAANFTEVDLGLEGADRFLISDYQNDQDIDILSMNEDGGTIDIFVNNGEDGFEKITVFTADKKLARFDIADIDGDNDDDFVVVLNDFSRPALILGIFDENTATFTTTTVADVGLGGLEQVLIDDFDQDGLIDIVGQTSSKCILWKRAAGSDIQFTEQTLIGGSIIRSFAITDVDRDGKKDLIVGRNSSDITWYKNLSNSTLEFESAVVGGVTPTFYIIPFDLDQDGDEDLIVSNGDFWWFRNEVPMDETSNTLSLIGSPVQVYPNPFKDFLTIDIDENITEVEIFDLFGRMVYQKNGNNKNIQLSHLPKGSYILSITENERKSSSLIIKH